jgi:hypothetical protein
VIDMHFATTDVPGCSHCDHRKHHKRRSDARDRACPNFPRVDHEFVGRAGGMKIKITRACQQRQIIDLVLIWT